MAQLIYLKLKGLLSSINQYILQKTILEGNWSYQLVQALAKAEFVRLLQSPCL